MNLALLLSSTFLLSFRCGTKNENAALAYDRSWIVRSVVDDFTDHYGQFFFIYRNVSKRGSKGRSIEKLISPIRNDFTDRGR